MADDFAAGGVGLEDLIEEAKEGAAHAKDSLAAVGAIVGLAEQARGQEGSQELLQMTETLLAQALDARAHGGEARPEGGKEGGVHWHSITTVSS